MAVQIIKEDKDFRKYLIRFGKNTEIQENDTQQFGGAILEVAHQKKGIKLTVDLENVEYLSPAACDKFPLAKILLKRSGGNIEMINANSSVYEVLTTLNFDKEFTITKKPDEAQCASNVA